MKNRQPKSRTRARVGIARRPWSSDRPVHTRVLVEVAVGLGVLSLSVLSAVLAKEAGHAPTLLALEKPSARVEAQARVEARAGSSVVPVVLATNTPSAAVPVGPALATPRSSEPTVEVLSDDPFAGDPEIRWFNDRPIRPARSIKMRVTAYSPDHRSCGIFADGQTATLHSVTTNGGALVAADPTVLPYGSLITVPGYDRERVVPVLDCGGAIKGNRLDVLYPTHEIARRWGVQDLVVTVWEYADGLPAENPRALR